MTSIVRSITFGICFCKSFVAKNLFSIKKEKRKERKKLISIIILLVPMLFNSCILFITILSLTLLCLNYKPSAY